MNLTTYKKQRQEEFEKKFPLDIGVHGNKIKHFHNKSINGVVEIIEKEKAQILVGFSRAMALICEGKYAEGNKIAEETIKNATFPLKENN